MDWNFYVAAIIGFFPSFGIMYFTWGKLEGLFSEKKLFFHYFVGWIVGIMLAVFFLISMVSVRVYLDLSIFFVLLFGVFTELAKYIYLNTPKKRKDYSLPYYGFAFGLGVAAIWSVSLAYYYLRTPMSNIDYAGAAISLLLLSLGLASIHASTGALLGYGIKIKFWEKYLLQSFGYILLFNLSLLPYIWNMHYSLFFIGLIVSVPVLYYKVYKGVLIQTIPKKVMKKWKETKE